ncbi:trace amine-associated receptor 1-like [Erpetoichthys calabaricus]|uniref:trace amine-associated receptor 1-like n=1 Tax=Erpetoichthys calabaricus TaxID=27687 RepID=UPI002234844C|nr:trace amine-associated receptor 1-like [Erpetoichthys calabaricus]
MNFTQRGITKDGYTCYASIENSCPKQVYSITARVLIYMTLWTITTFTLCGNLLVIISISHFKQLHTPTNFLTLSLAVADFLLGGLVMPPSMIRSVETCWYFGDFFCKFHSSTDMMLCTTSILHLSFISVDRYCAVCYPLVYHTKIGVSLIGKTVLICWSLSAMFGFGVIFLGLNIRGMENFDSQVLYCVGGCTLILNQTSGLVCSLISFYIPGFIMIVIYVKIFAVARKQAQTIEDKKKSTSRKRETKAAKTLSIVVGVFLICWSPYFFCSILDPIFNFSAPALIGEILIWFAYLNSTLNPLIYAFFYTWFRKALKIIVFGEIFKNNSSLTQLYSE